MLAFITTLRHPHNSTNYDRCELLLRDTLASVTRQTSNDFVVIVVGNRRPAFPLPRNTHFVEVDFPAPQTSHHSKKPDMQAVIWDKGTKNGIGLVAAREFSPDFAMFVDADDFLHRELAEYVHDHHASPGWAVKSGWMYSRKRNAYAFRRRLFRICGTTFILPFAAYKVSNELSLSSSQDEIADAFGDDALELIIGDHRYSWEWWAERGRQLESLPFPAVVYQVDTNENHSRSTLLGPALPYRAHLLDDFGIRPSRDHRASIWSAIGPAALKPDLRPRRLFFLKPLKPQFSRVGD